MTGAPAQRSSPTRPRYRDHPKYIPTAITAARNAVGGGRAPSRQRDARSRRPAAGTVPGREAPAAHSLLALGTPGRSARLRYLGGRQVSVWGGEGVDVVGEVEGGGLPLHLLRPGVDHLACAAGRAGVGSKKGTPVHGTGRGDARHGSASSGSGSAARGGWQRLRDALPQRCGKPRGASQGRGEREGVRAAGCCRSLVGFVAPGLQAGALPHAVIVQLVAWTARSRGSQAGGTW